jgi:uncharacterized membrane protein
MRSACSCLLVLAASVGAFGCADESAGNVTGASCNAALTYDADVAPIIERYCLSCHSASVPLVERHGAPGDHNFDSEADVLSSAEHIMLSAGIGPKGDNRSMPPHGQRAPDDTERETLARFLACHLGSGSASHHH